MNIEYIYLYLMHKWHELHLRKELDSSSYRRILQCGPLWSVIDHFPSLSTLSTYLVKDAIHHISGYLFHLNISIFSLSTVILLPTVSFAAPSPISVLTLPGASARYATFSFLQSAAIDRVSMLREAYEEIHSPPYSFSFSPCSSDRLMPFYPSFLYKESSIRSHPRHSPEWHFD